MGHGCEWSSPAEIRAAVRRGEFDRPTPGLAPGYAQANLVALPRESAYDFLLFCMRNPKPCPVLDVTAPGDPVPLMAAPQADLRTDLPRYRVYREGRLDEEVTDVRNLWRGDMVAFLLGCSFTFEEALVNAGIPVRHLEEGKNVPMFVTNVPCRPAGVFHGPLVVSMRPVPAPLIARAVQVTSRYPAVHGAPVHIGDPGMLGIGDVNCPDYGDAVTVYPGEVPVFWACGVTPQSVVMNSRPPFVITHAPGHMFITDLRNEELAAL